MESRRRPALMSKNSRTSPVLVVRWLDQESKGYTDLLPVEWFTAEGRYPGRVHLVTGPRGAKSQAKCNVNVRGPGADINYRPFSRLNMKWGNLLGVLRLRFADSRRQGTPAVLWKVSHSKRFQRGLGKAVLSRVRMMDPERLAPPAQQLLDAIVREIGRGRFVPGRPDTYLGYREAHAMLGLPRKGGTWGRSLKYHGLNDLAMWLRNKRLPAVTGLIVDTTKRRPGHGYFRMFNNGRESDGWWREEVRRAVEYDWTPYSRDLKPPTNRELSDYDEYTEGKRTTITMQTRRRCEALRKRARAFYTSPDGELRCAACGWTRPQTILRSSIVEIHHILPMAKLANRGTSRTVSEALKQMAPLCPNCHRVAHARPGGSSFSLKELKKVVTRA
jgi:hypothetical protein